MSKRPFNSAPWQAELRRSGWDSAGVLSWIRKYVQLRLNSVPSLLRNHEDLSVDLALLGCKNFACEIADSPSQEAL
jgi:hypothetical protein